MWNLSVLWRELILRGVIVPDFSKNSIKSERDFELRDFNELLKPAEEISFRNIDGVEMFFSARFTT